MKKVISGGEKILTEGNHAHGYRLPPALLRSFGGQVGDPEDPGLRRGAAEEKVRRDSRRGAEKEEERKDWWCFAPEGAVGGCPYTSPTLRLCRARPGNPEAARSAASRFTKTREASTVSDIGVFSSTRFKSNLAATAETQIKCRRNHLKSSQLQTS